MSHSLFRHKYTYIFFIIIFFFTGMDNTRGLDNKPSSNPAPMASFFVDSSDAFVNLSSEASKDLKLDLPGYPWSDRLPWFSNQTPANSSRDSRHFSSMRIRDNDLSPISRWFIAYMWLINLHRYRRDEAGLWLWSLQRAQRQMAHQWFRKLHRQRRDLAGSWFKQLERRRRHIDQDVETVEFRSSKNYVTNYISLKHRMSYTLMEKTVASLLHETIVRCLPAKSKGIYHGEYSIKQNNNFSVTCKEGLTRPLYTFASWQCGHDVKSYLGYSVPTMCVEKKLPLSVTMTRTVALTGLKNSGCGSYADLKTIQTKWREILKNEGGPSFKVDGLAFRLSKNPLGGYCNGTFRSRSQFKMEVSVKFRVYHTPVQFELGPNTREKVQFRLDNAVSRLLVTLSKMNHVDQYTLPKEALVFRAQGCKDPGSEIEDTERSFTHEIPACRVCDRGMYLDETSKMCIRCPRGFYSPGRGATQCMRCPLAEHVKTDTADSLHDCYAMPTCDSCYWYSIKEGVVVVIVYHVICLLTVAWNLRGALPAVGRDSTASVDDKTSRRNLSV